MENIINKLLEIDAHAKSVVLEYQEKKNNLDVYVSEEINKRKRDIDSTYNFKINFRKQEFQRKLEEKKSAMQKIKENGIKELQVRYNIEKERLANEIYNSIINKGV